MLLLGKVFIVKKYLDHCILCMHICGERRELSPELNGLLPQ